MGRLCQASLWPSQSRAGISGQIPALREAGTHNLSRTGFGKVAISNHRIVCIDSHKTTFSYKDYRQGAQKLEMSLDNLEFIRRFSLHILPKGLVRIRHFGILGSSAKQVTIPLIHRELGIPLPEKEPRILTEYNPRYCSCCQKESMISIQRLPKRGPPKATFSSGPTQF